MAPDTVPPRGAHPRLVIAAAVERYGTKEVVAWSERLLRRAERVDEPDIAWLGGSEEWLPYWRRVWAARAFLYVWAPEGSQGETIEAVGLALADEHWRVREMACKVVRARNLDGLASEVSRLLEDPTPRVRSAARRALVALRND